MFGAPFFPLKPEVYAEMLGKKLKETGAKVYLVNTGWCGGAAGTVPRIKLKYTRAMVAAAISGELDDVEFEHDDLFNLEIPKTINPILVPDEILNPKNVWKDEKAYKEASDKLAKAFNDNFNKKYPDMPDNIKNAGPKA